MVSSVKVMMNPYDVRDGVIAVTGNVAIGGREFPSALVCLGEGAASHAGSNAGIGTKNTLCCRPEVKSEEVGMKQ
jgi:hypothetical protein